MTSTIDVSGGAGGLDVEYDDLAAAAHVLELAALDVADTALNARRILADTGLLASAVLDPGGFARVEAAVLAAVLGPHGLLLTAGRLEGRSLSLHAAVLRYAAADRLDARLDDLRHWAESTALVLSLPMLPFLAVSPAGIATAGWVRGGHLDGFLSAHPGVAEEASGAAPSLLAGILDLSLGPAGLIAALVAPGHLASPGSSLEHAAGLVAMLYPAGSATVAGRGTDTSAPPAPRNVGDLITALGHRDDLSQGQGQGEIDIRRLSRVGADGATTTSWIVDLPGTKDWQVDPRRRDHLNDLATNLTTMAGDHSARVDGLTRALELAGVGRDEPVMLVGHSQGGLVAMRAAEQYAQDGRFTVTHVVTAGSPIARMPVPASVSVLALENRYDVVPQLDGETSPPDANRVTVVFESQSCDVGLNHAISTTYLGGAAAVDRDLTNPSLAAWRASAGAFLSPAGQPVTVDTTVWDIRNGG
ncbi:MAG: uncharacterized protein JWP11_1549 [Frankiales bacterium]|nr:uncharacterized protein [Frankiales bacterium]